MNHRRPTVGLIILLGALTAFDPLSIDMYLPAFPALQRAFSTSMAWVELSLSSFFVGLAVGQLIYGPLSDRFGRRRPLLIGMLVYLLASIGCVFSPSIGVFIVCRILQALGGCSGVVVSRAVVRDLFDPQSSAQIYSMLMLVMGLAPILAPMGGAYLAGAFGWRAIFIALASASALAIAIGAIFLKETRPPERRTRPSFKSYFELMRDVRFLGYTLSAGAVRAGLFAYIAGSPFVFIELFHVQPSHYSWIFGANAIGLIAASQVNSLLLRHYRVDQLLRAAACAAMIFATVLLVLPTTTSSIFGTLVPLFFFLMTLGFVGPNSAAGALAEQGQRAGTASALYGALQWGLATLSSVLVSRLHDGTSFPMRLVIFIAGFSAWLLMRASVRAPVAQEPLSGSGAVIR